MAIILENQNRHVIPNWRDFNRTITLGELGFNSIGKSIQFDITQQINDWHNLKTIATAADLINAAFISSNTDIKEVNEAVAFVNNNKDIASKSLIDLAVRVNTDYHNLVDNKELNETLEVDSFEEFQNVIDTNRLYAYIKKLKSKTIKEPYNSINWVELSRLYAIFNQTNKAERAMDSAITLAPNNRFVLRSATRLYIHINKHEKALSILKSSRLSKNDPWIISAHIATSSLLEKYSPLIKNGFEIIDSKKHTNYDITELASSLGTLEFYNGSLKKSKGLFNTSMLSPNDNTLAQLDYISSYEKSFNFNPLEYSNVKNSFEAFANEQLDLGRWEDALNNTVKWFLDIPYSKRPILLGSYIASTLTNNFETAITLCEVGLNANPYDPVILNNLVYSLAVSNKIDKGGKYITQLSKIKFNSLSEEMKITIQATLGLVAFKQNDIETGKRLYELAILNSQTLKDPYLESLALINYARELIINNCIEKNFIIKRIENQEYMDNREDLKHLKKQIIRLYNNSRFNI